MPLVPLYDQSAPPHTTHRVRAPGGYESWRIAACDAKQDLLLFAAVHEGCLADPGYIKAWRRYLRRPTRTTPPLPQNYAAEEFAIYHRGQRITSSFTRLPPQPIFAEASNQLRIGKSTLILDPIGPASSLDETTLNSSHHWIISNPLRSLSGALEQFTIDALAICDHRLGTSPPSAPCWLDGAVFFPDSALLFQATPTTSWIIQAGRDGTSLIDQPLSLDSIASGPFRTQYPRTILLADGATLTSPRIIDRSPHRIRLIYEASFDAKGEVGHAFCEISYPQRLTWPFIEFFVPRPKAGVPQLTVPAIPPA